MPNPKGVNPNQKTWLLVVLNRRKASNANCFVSPGLALSVLDFAHLDPPLPLRCAARVGVASAVLSCPGGVFGGVETLEIQGLEAGNVPELRICLAGFGGRIKLNASLLGFQVEFNCEFQWFQMHAQSLFLFMVVSQSVNNMHCPIDRNILH